MKRLIIVCILALVAVWSCNKNRMEILDINGQMRINALYPSVLTRAGESSFESGDKIGVFVTEYYEDGTPSPLQIAGNWATNIATTFDGTTWQTARPIFWSERKMDVYGYYPYMDLVSVYDQPFSVELDQNEAATTESLSAYEASDILWAKTEGVEAGDTGDPVELQFKHIMSKMVVNLVKGEDYQGVFPDEGTLYIHYVVPSATLDLVNGVPVKDPYGTPVTITARRVDNETFEAILVPQRLESRRPFLEYVANGVSYLVEDTFNFKTGRQYTYNLTINSNPDQIAIEIGGETGNWN